MSGARLENKEDKQVVKTSPLFFQVGSEQKVSAVPSSTLAAILPFSTSLCRMILGYSEYSFNDLLNLLREDKHNIVDEIELELTSSLKESLMQYNMLLALYFIPHRQWPQNAMTHDEVLGYEAENEDLADYVHFKDDLGILNKTKNDELLSHRFETKQLAAANNLTMRLHFFKHVKLSQDDLHNLLGKDFTGLSENVSPFLRNQLKNFLINLDEKLVPGVCKSLMANWRKMRIDSSSQTNCNFFQEVNDNPEDLLALYWLLGAETEKELWNRITVIKTPKPDGDDSPTVSDLFTKILDLSLNKPNTLIPNGKA